MNDYIDILKEKAERFERWFYKACGVIIGLLLTVVSLVLTLLHQQP